MASITPKPSDVVLLKSNRFPPTSFLASKFPLRPTSVIIPNRKPRTRLVITASSHTFDVVIVGAGIIGLTIARQFLFESYLSVALVDKAVPCSGATGAGQGYIWMVNKTSESDTWHLTKRSHELWERFAESVRAQGRCPLKELGWQKKGSLLVGRTVKDSVLLKKRVKQLSEAGLRAEYLSSHDLREKETALVVGEGGGAAFLPDDCQLDAHRTVAYIERANRQFASKGRYAEFYHELVISLLRSDINGEVLGVLTSKNTLYSKKAITIASGCWSGPLSRDLFRGSAIALDIPVKPRKGYLLVIENSGFLKLNHGLMEVGYIDNEHVKIESRTSDAGMVDQGQMLSVSMTATMDAAGNLVLGSSRQFAGFDTELDRSVIDIIWKRAGEFFPKLKELSIDDFSKGRKERIGLRPYMPDGKPVIGPVPGLPNIIIATGHEGGGLSMALGTAEMVADMVLDNSGTLDCAPFSVQGRCC